MQVRAARLPPAGPDAAAPSTGREVTVTVFVVIALLFLYYGLPMQGRLWPIAAFAGPLVAALTIPMTVRHARRILAAQRPMLAVVQGVVNVLVLLLLGFAASFFVLSIHAPDEMPALETKTDALYYSVTVLATVGFGDIHPEGQLARALATFQMLANLAVVGASLRFLLWAGQVRADSPGPDDGSGGPRRSPLASRKV